VYASRVVLKFGARFGCSGGMKKSFMRAKVKEHICKACNGTGFPKVKQPPLAIRKIYPMKCEICAGKGKVADATN
jgi:DnaJ-class molecular chaperone